MVVGGGVKYWQLNNRQDVEIITVFLYIGSYGRYTFDSKGTDGRER